MNNTHRLTLIRGGGDGVVWFAAGEAQRRIAEGVRFVHLVASEHGLIHQRRDKPNEESFCFVG